MKEIKFRAIQAGTNKMIFGLPYSVYGSGIDSIQRSDYNEIEYIRTDTIGQYTGLKDINCTEIYEGDIVKYTRWHEDNKPYKAIYRVAFERLTWTLISVPRDYSVLLWQQLDPSVIQNLNNDKCEARELKILGNIHQNPELLEQSK